MSSSPAFSFVKANEIPLILEARNVSMRERLQLESMNVEELQHLIREREAELCVIKDQLDQKANPQISINVVQTSGRSIPLTVKTNTPIHVLARKIRVALELGEAPLPVMTLICGGKKLRAQDKLHDYGMIGGETVSVVLCSEGEGGTAGEGSEISRKDELRAEIQHLAQRMQGVLRLAQAQE